MTTKFALRDQTFAPHLSLLLVQIMFGTWPIFGKIVLRSVSSVGLVGFRICGAAIIFTLLHRKFAELRRLPKKDLLLLVLCSLLGVVINQLVYVTGLSLTTVINATLLTTTIPAFTLGISIALGHDRGSFAQFLGIALAAAGAIYLIDPFRASFSAETTLGNVLIMSSSLSYGAYIAVSRNLVKQYGALNVITWLFMIATVVTLPLSMFAWANDNLSSVTATSWLCVIYIILVPTIGAYYLNAWALTKVAPSIVAIYIYLQPLLAFGLAPMFLGERLSATTLVACTLIFVGVGVVTLAGRSKIVEEISEHPDALSH